MKDLQRDYSKQDAFALGITRAPYDLLQSKITHSDPRLLTPIQDYLLQSTKTAILVDLASAQLSLWNWSDPGN